MMTSGTLISYLHLCHPKHWLHHHHIRMEQNSQALAAGGKHIGETTYECQPQKWRELNLGNLKIDHFDTSIKTVREVKKSPRLEHAHVTGEKTDWEELLMVKLMHNLCNLFHPKTSPKSTLKSGKIPTGTFSPLV